MTNSKCKLLEGFLTYFLQCILGLISLSALYWKWKNEYPKRQKKVFIFDVSKQIIGMGFAHLLNICIAIMISKKYILDDDECRWYFLNFFVDVLFGTSLNYLFIKIAKKYIKKHKLKFLKIGEYTHAVSLCNKSYFQQVILWVIIILLSKCLILILILIPFHKLLDNFGKWFLNPISHNNDLELTIVMVILPLILNLIQFWIQDNFLKGKKHYIDKCSISDIDDFTNNSPKYKKHTNNTGNSPRLSDTLMSKYPDYAEL